MSYRIEIEPGPARAIRGLPTSVQQRVRSRLLEIEVEPRLAGRKLKNREDYRARVGDYRILYYIDDGVQVVNVWRIAHRRDVYEDL